MKPRGIPLPGEALDALAATVRRLDGRVLSRTSNTISKSFQSLCVELRIDTLRFRDLRPTAITNRGGWRGSPDQPSNHRRLYGQSARPLHRIDLVDLRRAVARREAREPHAAQPTELR